VQPPNKQLQRTVIPSRAAAELRALGAFSMAIPSLDAWIELPDDERTRRMAASNPYVGEGAELVRQISGRLREQLKNLREVAIDDGGIYHGGSWTIRVTHPFIFDRRLIPERYLGVEIRAGARPPLPPEFEGQAANGYVWSPRNFERFVERCAGEIRQRLGRPSMTREEMLHALIGRPYEEHLSICRRWVTEGVIPPFE
jgi:hypothetical protein